MPCEVLIRATNNPAGSILKGSPCVVRDTPWEWGGKEGLPNWVILEVPDAASFELDHWMKPWNLKHKHTVLADTLTLVKVRFEVDDSAISVSGKGRDEIKLAAQEWVEHERFGGVIQTVNPQFIVVDFPKPVDVDEVVWEFGDTFNVAFDIRVFYIPDSDIDAAVVAGGRFSKALAQAEAMVKDKMLE